MAIPSDAPIARLLIVRTSAIGDVVFASPFAAAVKRTWPQAHVAWLVEPGIHELLAADPCIDELILWPKGEWKQLWQARRFGELFRRIRAFRALLRAKRFDTAIDMQSLLKSGLLTWLSGAPRRIGLGSREGSQWLMTERVPKGGIARRIGSEYRYLAEQLGLDAGEFLPRLCVGDDTEAKVQALMAAHGLARKRFAVFAPFTTRPQKHWFEDAWQALVPKVRDELGLTPVILGGPADREAAARIAGSTPGVVSLAGATRLPEAAALIRHAGLLVGVDTGLT
uniref:glycosyltransferase family 9 protein n=1 Tax=Thauera sp. TaxID=1905334 RepID=UPI00257DE078